ncbi:MAG: acyl-CoA dehydrogenase C-terminal domain-containing protein, partial [Gammaproteobacteria bacterium]
GQAGADAFLDRVDVDQLTAPRRASLAQLLRLDARFAGHELPAVAELLSRAWGLLPAGIRAAERASIGGDLAAVLADLGHPDQALDLLGRKVLMTKGESLKQFTKIIHLFCKENAKDKKMDEFISPLSKLNNEWGSITMKIGMKAITNRDEVGAASVDYLMYSGYIALAYFWARMAKTAQEKLQQGTGEEAFYQAKITTARFYYQRLLPRTSSLMETMLSGADNLMSLDEESFIF